VLLHETYKEKMISSFSMESCCPNFPVSHKNFLILETAEIVELWEWALRRGVDDVWSSFSKDWNGV